MRKFCTDNLLCVFFFIYNIFRLYKKSIGSKIRGGGKKLFSLKILNGLTSVILDKIFERKRSNVPFNY